MGVVHVRAWQVAYRGEFPDEYLDGLKASDRAALWSRFIPRGGVVVFEDNGGVTGFASFGSSSDPEGLGELFAMNVDPEHWGRGHGSALLNYAVGGLRCWATPKPFFGPACSTIVLSRFIDTMDGALTAE